MGWEPKQIDATIAGLTNATYAVGDQLGTLTTIPAAAPGNGGEGAITGVAVIDQQDVLGAVDMFIFTDSVTPAADNAAATFSDADALFIVAGTPLYVPAGIDVGGARIAGLTNLWIPYECGAGHDDLFVSLTTRTANAAISTATAIKFRFSVMHFVP